MLTFGRTPLKLAIISKNNDILIEVPPETFRKNLIEYSNTMSVEEAFDLLCSELKERTKRI